ncbi:MAG: YHYH protein [Actinomycetota bacterium]
MNTRRLIRSGAALAGLAVTITACGSDDTSTDSDTAVEATEPVDADASTADAAPADAGTASSAPSDADTVSPDSEVSEPTDTDEASDTASTSDPAASGADDDATAGAASDPPDEAVDDGLPDSLASAYLGSYELMDEAFGTMVTVTVEDGVRLIESNTLPDHETGEFPNSGNPNAISEQDRTWQFAANGTNTGVATEVRETGVAVNGVKFEPGTAETLTCASGETYRIEALQEMFDLGLDFNNAHVQPGGEYHYHGVSELLVGAYESDQDLVHIGFAADGNLLYYSKSGAFSSGYSLSNDARAGTDCLASGPNGQTFDVAGTTPDGTYAEDFVFDAATGELDECNGVEIDGEYVYLITDEYPYISRCLKGEVAAGAGGPGAGGPPGGEAGGGQAAPGAEAGDTNADAAGQGGAPPDAPDFAEAAAALGVTEDELLAALGTPPDFEEAAAILGVTVQDLEAVLPAPPDR